MPSGRGNPFRASGPFAPAGRGKRAEKGACDFTDETIQDDAISGDDRAAGTQGKDQVIVRNKSGDPYISS